MNKILIIEDNEEINGMLNQLLTAQGYQTARAYSGTEGVLLHSKEINLILLDLMLPGKNGEEIIQELKRKKQVPVIVMSAIHDIDKKLGLFQLGADDYITKPFNNEELLARIKVHLRNHIDIENHHILNYKDIVIDIDNFIVNCNNQQIILTKCEFRLLKTLMENPKQVYTKSILFNRVWGDEDSADENTLNVHISKIRNKLKEANPKEDYIETIWSIGYRMKKEDDSKA